MDIKRGFAVVFAVLAGVMAFYVTRYLVVKYILRRDENAKKLRVEAAAVILKFTNQLEEYCPHSETVKLNIRIVRRNANQFVENGEMADFQALNDSVAELSNAVEVYLQLHPGMLTAA